MPASRSGANAGDYVVAWAFDDGNQNETGKRTDCEYGAICRIKSEKLIFDLALSFSHPDPTDPRHKDVTVDISNGPIGCCYFDDGVMSIDRSILDSLVHLRVYVGQKRKRNEFIRNLMVGHLYLGFFDVK